MTHEFDVVRADKATPKQPIVRRTDRTLHVDVNRFLLTGACGVVLGKWKRVAGPDGMRTDLLEEVTNFTRSNIEGKAT